MFGFKRSTDNIRQLIHVRYTDEWVGVLVLLCLIAFGAAVIEAGVLRDWLTPSANLRIVLPETGVANLSVGDDVEVFGIHAGTIRRISVNPSGGLYALAELDPQVKIYIRRDSQAIIRRRFAVAGATYISISRGTGEALDWNYAVLTATTEPNPADTITQMLVQMHEKILPILDNAQLMTAHLRDVSADIRNGKGTVGRLVTSNELSRKTERMVQSLNTVIEELKPIEQRVTTVLHHTDGVIQHSDVVLGNLRRASHDLQLATPRMPRLIKNLDQSTENLPALLTQTQLMVDQLDKLAKQLRSVWYLGGGGIQTKEPSPRLPAQEVRP